MLSSAQHSTTNTTTTKEARVLRNRASAEKSRRKKEDQIVALRRDLQLSQDRLLILSHCLAGLQQGPSDSNIASSSSSWTSSPQDTSPFTPYHLTSHHLEACTNSTSFSSLGPAVSSF